MFYRSISLFVWILVAVVEANDYNESDPITAPVPEVTIYRLRSDHQLEKFEDDYAAELAATTEELIRAHDYEREFLTNTTQSNFTEYADPEPYYEPPKKDLCMEDNGNCSQKCEMVRYQRVCSCREGFTLTSSTNCSEISGTNIVLSGTSGNFTVDKNYGQWTIQAPNNHIIEIRLKVTPNYSYASSGTIYDGNSTSATVIKYIDRNTEAVLTSSGQNLLIVSSYYWGSGYGILHVSYITGPKYLQMDDGKTVGNLEIPATLLSGGEECFSLTYSTPQYDNLTVTLNQENDDLLQALTPGYSFMRHDGKWKRHVFRVPFHEGAKSLKFQFHGEGTRVYNLGRCLNLEYHAAGGPQSLGPKSVCRNGGVWNSTTQSCICPQGFVGIHCEEGCGPNRYGEKCSSLCSYLSNACEGTIFCTKEVCLCAPGLHGTNCDLPCYPGHYGASCQQHCGRCKDHKPCDRYTGRCYSGCSTGFYPPFCQQTYKVLSNAPEIIAVTYNSLKIRTSFEAVTGEGEPVLYQVQYKEEKQEFWSKLSPRVISNETEFEIGGLQASKDYETRVILIDKDGDSYQADVPKSKARTKCTEPNEGNYKFAVKETDESSVVLEWSYEHDNTSLWCEIVEYELSVDCGHQHFKLPITEVKGNKRIPNLIPDTSYSFQLIGITVNSKRTLPKNKEGHTLPAAPRIVRAVSAVPFGSSRQLNVSWQPPWDLQDEQLRYKVTYQCVRLLACGDASCSESFGDTQVSRTSAILHQLQPHAVYQIGISSVSNGGLVSESYIINAVTPHAAPHEPPSTGENPILAVTNTSVLLSWMPPKDCSALNGYIYGYTYALVDKETEAFIQHGSVPENVLSLNFSRLTPSHCYGAHIKVVASGGESLSSVLVIPFCTRSTAPDQVQSLSVYKKGRRMVGLRWSPPLKTYGEIEYFIISYSVKGSNYIKHLVIEPKHCGAWVDLYCHTVSGLSPGKKYRFQVQARNKEVSNDGEPAAVESVTIEGASTPPVNLRMINATENSMWLEWNMPDNINGQLRTFMIIVEQIDMQLNSDCCDEVLLLDYRVASEEPVYQYEVTDLSAASTYSVKVSAKTVTLGEESEIISHTYPPKPSLTQNALTVVETEKSNYNPEIVTLQIEPVQTIIGINRTYILFCLTNASSAQQPFDDAELSTLLQSRFNGNYHLLSKFTQEEVENQPVVTFDLKDLGLESTEAQLQKFALILIHDYMGNRNMDIFVTEERGV